MARNLSDNWEVVWNGGPLLPDRPTEPDPRWGSLALFYTNMEVRGVDYESVTQKVKRTYNKCKSDYWVRRSQPGPFVQHRTAAATSEAEAARAEPARHSPERLSSGPHPSEGRIEESLCPRKEK